MDTNHPHETDAAHKPAPAAITAPPPRLTPRAVRTRLVLLVTSVLIPLILLIALVVVGAYVRAKRGAEITVLRTAQSTIASVDIELRNQIAALEVLALAPDLQTGNFSGFNNDAQRFLTRYPPGTGVAVGDVTGQILYSSRIPIGEPLPKRPDQANVDAVFRTNQPYVSDIFPGRLQKRPVVSVDVPIRRDGVVIYDLASSRPRSVFADILRSQNLPNGWVIAIFDRVGHHVVRIPALPGEEITSASASLMPQLADEHDRIVDSLSLEGTPLLTAIAHSSVTGWTLALGIPYEVVNGPARRTMYVAIGFSAVVLLLSIFLASRLATQLTRAEIHRELLTNELNHRVKNTLSIVQGIVGRGLREMPGSEKYRAAIEARLLALSSAHNVLGEQKWEKADLRAIASSIISPYITSQQTLDIKGASVVLKPRVAIALAMILNELATNASKYGALSVPTGRVTVTWQLTPPNQLRLTWTEAGGPPASPPVKPGYGTKFIERAVSGELNGSYTATYVAQGLDCAIEITL